MPKNGKCKKHIPIDRIQAIFNLYRNAAKSNGKTSKLNKAIEATQAIDSNFHQRFFEKLKEASGLSRQEILNYRNINGAEDRLRKGLRARRDKLEEQFDFVAGQAVDIAKTKPAPQYKRSRTSIRNEPTVPAI